MPKYTEEQLDYLYRRAKQGSTTMNMDVPPHEAGLSIEELDDLAVELQTTDNYRYQSDIIRILHYAAIEHTDKFRHVLAPFLNDPVHVRTVLKILCCDWLVAPYYKKELTAFIR